VTVVLIVLGAVVLAAAIMVVALAVVRRRAHRLRDELLREIGATPARLANAQGFGLRSAGARQLRGNGWLVLTGAELIFRQWVPARDTRVPLPSIRSVATVRSWLGKRVGVDLLCVEWQGSNGEGDAMAWRVNELPGWLANLSPHAQTG